MSHTKQQKRQLWLFCIIVPSFCTVSYKLVVLPSLLLCSYTLLTFRFHCVNTILFWLYLHILFVFRCPLRSKNGSTRAYRPIVAAVVVTRPSRSTPQEKTALGLACRCVLGGMRINYGKFHQTRTARLAQMHSLPAMSAGDLVILLRAVRDYFNLAFWVCVCVCECVITHNHVSYLYMHQI